jgi:IS5 family transposase
VFLAEMEQVVPWPALCRLIDPVYPKAGNGRPPITPPIALSGLTA